MSTPVPSSTSPTLAFAQPLGEELAASPEFRYLATWVRTRVEAVFGPLAAPGTPEAAELPLLVVGPRTLLADRTLETLKRRLETGDASVMAPMAPVRIATWLGRLTGDDAPHPVHTLRGYERLEAQLLERGGGDGGDRLEPTTAPWPAVLIPAGRGAQLSADLLRRHPESVLGGISAGVSDDAPDAAETVTAEPVGVCHEFVDYYGVVRDDVLPHLPDGVETVLEVGCARGLTGRLLQERLGCRVTGIELNPVVAREAAKHLHRVVAADVQTVDPAELGAPFDALVATELFEHLTEQEAFLARARQLLRPGGRMILSVPNVGHWSIVEDLLAGRWDYLPIGLLCHTHFRFFTRRTLEDWLRGAGFDRFELHPQHTELPEDFVGPLGSGLEVDRESLRTKGFTVVAESPGAG